MTRQPEQPPPERGGALLLPPGLPETASAARGGWIDQARATALSFRGTRRSWRGCAARSWARRWSPERSRSGTPASTTPGPPTTGRRSAPASVGRCAGHPPNARSRISSRRSAVQPTGRPPTCSRAASRRSSIPRRRPSARPGDLDQYLDARPRAFARADRPARRQPGVGTRLPRHRRPGPPAPDRRTNLDRLHIKAGWRLPAHPLWGHPDRPARGPVTTRRPQRSPSTPALRDQYQLNLRWRISAYLQSRPRPGRPRITAQMKHRVPNMGALRANGRSGAARP
jgi:hypothetical protein